MKNRKYRLIMFYPIIISISIIYWMYSSLRGHENFIVKFFNDPIKSSISVILALLMLIVLIIKPRRNPKITLNTLQGDNEEHLVIIEPTEKRENKKSYFGGIHTPEIDDMPKQKIININHGTKHNIFSFNVPKLLESKSDDSIVVQKSGSEIVIGVSDGASTSLYSGLWGNNILKFFSKSLYKYTNNKNKFLETLGKFVDVEGKERSRIMQEKKLPWHAYAKLSKGSDASLTGVHIKGDILYYAIIGDSPLIIIKDKQVFFYPYQNSVDFSQNPILINTDNIQNEKIKESLIMGTYKLNNNEKIIVCTDGIGKFLLSIYEKNHNEFLKVIDIILKAKNPISNIITEFKNKGHHFGDEKVVMKDDDISFVYFIYKKKLFPW